jgi:Cu/Ag efflux pump CusA
VAEAVAGFKAENGIKIYGDLKHFGYTCRKSFKRDKDIKGVKDAGIHKNIGQPEVSVVLDRDKMAAYGVMPDDAQVFWKWLSEEKPLQKCLMAKENSRSVSVIRRSTEKMKMILQP